jgi:uncharacterized protein with von Willebrand factor type A (vWA) domain
MEVTLTRFVHALRNAELPVSPAETLDGFEVVQHIGIADPKLLKNSLALVLAKTREEKRIFADCFERFFHQLAFQQPVKKTMLRGVDGEQLLSEVAVEGNEALTEAVGAILRGDHSELAWRVQAAAEQPARRPFRAGLAGTGCGGATAAERDAQPA